VRFLLRFIVRVAVNSLAVWVCLWLLEGFSIEPYTISSLGARLSPLIQTLIGAGLVLALLNLIVRPILKLLSLPLVILTFGLFSFVINVIILWLADALLLSLAISGLSAYLIGSFIIALANSIVDHSS
jgi:putative membrane protein